MPTKEPEGRRERARAIAEALLSVNREANRADTNGATGAMDAIVDRADGLLRIQQARRRADARRAEGAWSASEADRSTLGLDLREVLRRIHGMMLEHPVAGRAIFEALCAEGRAFARSHEGRELRVQLASSRALRRAGLVWRTVTSGLLEAAPSDDPGRLLPSAYLDNLLKALDRPDLERVLGSLITAAGNRR
jgi:hypothetical protein